MRVATLGAGDDADDIGVGGAAAGGVTGHAFEARPTGNHVVAVS